MLENFATVLVFSNPTKGLFMGYENSPIFSDETPGKKVFLHLRGIREETLLRWFTSL